MRFQQYTFSGIAGNADYYSAPIEVASVFALGYTAELESGDAKGKCYVQVSCDPINQTPVNWVSLSSHADLTGSATVAYVYNELCANWIRFFWDHNGSGSTGTVEIRLKTNGY